MSIMRKPEENEPKKAIVLKDSVYHSKLGEYFLGQTEMIRYQGDLQGWGGLFNPADSGVTMYLNAYTISNFCDRPITAQGWLGGEYSGQSLISGNVAAGNQSITPAPQPKVLIRSASFVTELPQNGTYTFVRRVEPAITLTKHDFQGMYIIPPGSSFTLFFLPPGDVYAYTKIAFGWWEEGRM